MAYKHKFAVAFLQSLGHQTMSGELVTAWDMSGKDDLHYTDAVLKDIPGFMKSKAPGLSIDSTRVYVIGLSNGGIFSASVAVHFHNRIAAVCNYMGGYMHGYSEKITADMQQVPTLIIIGDEDHGMMRLCRIAEQVFTAAGWPVEFKISPGVAHVYEKKYEPYIWNFLYSHTKPNAVS